MNTKYNYLFIVSILSLTLFTVLANTYDSNVIEYLDIQGIKRIQSFEQANITFVMKFFSYIGDTLRVILISVMILFVLFKVFHQRKELILFLVVLIGSTILNVLLKNYFHRERPNLVRMIIEDGYSFPSGHTMAALSLYGIISFLMWRHIPQQSGRILFICISAFFILGIGLSRIYLGAHYPSDVLGAYLISGSWLTFTIWGFINVKERSFRQKRVTLRNN